MNKVRVEQDRMFVKLGGELEMEFCRVPAGVCTMGGDLKKDKRVIKKEQSVHTVQLKEYWLGRYPVTNRQYATFVSASGHAASRHWEDGNIPSWKEEHPVVRVSWQDATEFCAWLKEVSGEAIRLPTEAEWEKAARGTGGRLYPWGWEPPDGRFANFGQQVMDTTPVGLYSPAGDSPYGCADMAGNVEEWCADWCQTYPDRKYCETYRGIRGSSWITDEWNLRSSLRVWSVPSYWYNYIGFRCAL